MNEYKELRATTDGLMYRDFTKLSLGERLLVFHSRLAHQQPLSKPERAGLLDLLAALSMCAEPELLSLLDRTLTS